MLKIPKSKTAAQLLTMLIGLALIGYGGSYFLARYKSQHQPLTNPSVVIATAAGDPSETPVTTKQVTYNVAGNKPKLISIPSLGSEGFVQQVAIDTKTNAMAVPNNIDLAGWYVNSVAPGDNGLSIINGHVSGRYRPGIFKNLRTLKPGATFYVQFGDGSRRNFAVVSNNTYSVSQVTQYLYAKDPAISNQLNLITCGGTFDKASRQYDARVLVVAKRI